VWEIFGRISVVAGATTAGVAQLRRIQRIMSARHCPARSR
jgi:hypothetical protein